MTDVEQLGQIEWLADIRSIWKHEAADFTPWLLANAAELGTALGIRISLDAAEHAVGSFSLDLVGHDHEHECRLIVENQLEVSDHAHLGQLLTYTAGTDASTIVWITREFNDQHRIALDWLNEHTGEDTRFFGVVIKALRIGNSLPAPFFELAAKPNDWQKSVRAVTAGQESAQAEAYQAFWLPLQSAIQDQYPDLVEKRNPPRWIWFTISSPIPQTSLYGEIGAKELRTILSVMGKDGEHVKALAALEAHRPTLDARLDPGLEPVEFVAGEKSSRVLRRRELPGKLLEQPEELHDEARQWFQRSLLDFRHALEEVAPAYTSSASAL